MSKKVDCIRELKSIPGNVFLWETTHLLWSQGREKQTWFWNLYCRSSSGTKINPIGFSACGKRRAGNGDQCLCCGWPRVKVSPFHLRLSCSGNISKLFCPTQSLNEISLIFWIPQAIPLSQNSFKLSCFFPPMWPFKQRSFHSWVFIPSFLCALWSHHRRNYRNHSRNYRKPLKYL